MAFEEAPKGASEEVRAKEVLSQSVHFHIRTFRRAIKGRAQGQGSIQAGKPLW